MTATAPARQRLLTIGTVCRRLKPEFPDISISKIRYLEDQGLMTPKRTQGGYRLFGEDDVERLETILRLQRDEFLPLRVIREELRPARGRSAGGGARLGEAEEGLELEELCERPASTRARARARGVRAARAAREAGSASTRRGISTSRSPARACALRDRAAPSARIPHGGRPGSGAPPGDRRARAPRAQPRTARAGG